MLPSLIVLSLLVAILVYIWGHGAWLQWQENQCQKRDFPLVWQQILSDRLPFWSQLSPRQKQCLQGKIQFFLQQKQFIGCQDFEITTEVKLIIAAIASYLALNLGVNPYPRLATILVYPDAFQVKQQKVESEYVVSEHNVAVSGQSWQKAGQITLAWATILWDLQRWQDGHNVVVHEFSHQLDLGDGEMNGVPKLADASLSQRWRQVFTAEYEQLRSQINHQTPTIIDPYGATDPREFFAVAVETYLEKGELLRHQHRRLYDLLHDYLGISPLTDGSFGRGFPTE